MYLSVAFNSHQWFPVHFRNLELHIELEPELDFSSILSLSVNPISPCHTHCCALPLTRQIFIILLNRSHHLSIPFNCFPILHSRSDVSPHTRHNSRHKSNIRHHYVPKFISSPTTTTDTTSILYPSQYLIENHFTSRS